MKPRTGSILINNRQAHDPSLRSIRRVCRAKPALFGAMSVDDHLTIASRSRGTAPAEARNRLARYGAGEWLEHSADALSTGNARKLWIVLATLGQANIVVLDEPFNGLDRHGANVLRDEITDWAHTGIVVLIAHELPVTLPERWQHRLAPSH